MNPHPRVGVLVYTDLEGAVEHTLRLLLVNRVNNRVSGIDAAPQRP